MRLIENDLQNKLNDGKLRRKLKLHHMCLMKKYY